MRRRGQAPGAGALALILVGASGCPIGDLLTGTEHDSGVVTSDAPSDVQVPPDGGLEDGEYSDGSSELYYSLNDPERWTFLDVTSVGGQATYSGVAFDGRYLYFVPNFSPPVVLRYDTQGGLSDPTAWSHYAVLPNIVAAGGSSAGVYTYLGGAFDGRYVYLAPFGTNTYALQYDTQGTFTSGAAWSAFPTTVLDPNADYWGVVSDGRHAYFIPNATTTIVAYDALSADAGSGFSAPSSWSSYDLGTGADYGGFWGGLYDGQYLYLAPFTGNVASRYDTTLPLGMATSWNLGVNGFDFYHNEQISPPHFWGSAFDGSRLYLLPYKTQGLTIAAYTMPGAFADDSSWATCALAHLTGSTGGGTPGFVGAAYDGQRIFLAPAGKTANGGPLPIIEYDTTQPLCPTDLASAYTAFDPTSVPGGKNAQGFEGAAFDGQYVYFVPHATSILARFQAKSQNLGLSPSTYRGSWW
jgi:hypothetical protein